MVSRVIVWSLPRLCLFFVINGEGMRGEWVDAKHTYFVGNILKRGEKPEKIRIEQGEMEGGPAALFTPFFRSL